MSLESRISRLENQGGGGSNLTPEMVAEDCMAMALSGPMPDSQRDRWAANPEGILQRIIVVNFCPAAIAQL
jgi:hypothetical protein